MSNRRISPFAGCAGIKAAADFEQAFERVRAIADLPADDLETLKRDALALSRRSERLSPAEALRRLAWKLLGYEL